MSRAFESARTHPLVLARHEEERRLRELGHRPLAARRMGGFGNFAAGFSVISVLSGCMTLYGFGLGTGGPAVMLWGWAGAGLLVLCAGLALAEVTSSCPASGALYYVAGRLGGRRWGWYTGWLNLLGLLGAIAGADYGAALFTGAFANLRWGWEPTPGRTMLVFIAILLLHAVLNLFGIRLLGVLNSVSVWWHLGGVALIAGALAVVPDHHRPPSFVFTTFVDDTGWSHPLYVAAVGLLLAQYTLSGHDACAHLAEETAGASVAVARGIVRSIAVSWLAGLVLLAGLTFAIRDYDTTLASPTGVPPAQILLDGLGRDGASAVLLVAVVAQLLCGAAVVAVAGRMVFAFSRERALPGSSLWRRVGGRTRTPVAAVWLSVSLACVLALPSLYSATAYGAVTAVGVVGFAPAYAIPVLLRLRAGDRFRPGPWRLGRFGRPVGWTAVAWGALATVLFCLPQSSPVTLGTLNYAPVALAAVLILASVWWYVARRPHGGTPVSAAYGTERDQAELAEGIV
ncbi:amino acid permease [Streptomyces anandii]|uniref:amino acid permease n=1 Tax=Streptomyces anandii TaxID=285454 RepID=UPI00167A4D34|nr:amino acid permease [Streptomyces anandii]GGX76198.1 amino acid permease [Streptomyces anandii JCM 4720]